MSDPIGSPATSAPDAARTQADDAFMADLGVIGSSLDCGQAIRDFAGICATRLADCAVVSLTEKDGQPGISAFACKDTARDTSASALATEVRARLAYTISTGKATLYPPDEASADGRRLLRPQLTRRNCVVVPMSIRGSIDGAVMLARVSPYDTRDIALLERAAARLASAVDNARRYAEATRSLRAHDEMLSFVTHDLRNPLNVIIMAADLLRERNSGHDEFTAHWLHAILQSAERMNDLIQDLLTSARTSAGTAVLQRRRVPARVLLHEAFAAHEDAAADKQIRTDISVPQENLDVDVDYNSIVRALSNLIGNAVRHTPAHGELRLSAHARDEMVEFCVQDTGSGIAPEHLAHIFDRFWQAPGSRSGAAGLGLAIVKSIVEAHGGEVRVESTQGKGSSFYFTVPVHVAAHTLAVVSTSR